MGTIVVGIDGSATAEQAARHAAELANAISGTLRLVTAYRPHETVEIESGADRWHIDGLQQAEELLASTATSLSLTCEYELAARAGKPADVLVEEAETSGADYIVVGNKHVQGVGRVLGSVASSVLKRAPCAVVVAKTT